MNSQFPTAVLRFLLLFLLSSAGIFASACEKEEPSDEEKIKNYIAEKQITNAQRQSSGLYYVPVVTADTSQVKAKAGKTVSVLYTGTLLDGTVFDASIRHGNVPISFILGRGQVIAGWDEGIALMRKGEKSQLLIPSALGYGSSGSGSSIPPNTVLRFEVELVNVR